ncbi:hypothetical protein [Mesorhizobium sp. B2-8-3]|uniref:hypothetical protein n=1 Tax=Mesorhizobium sp. B2-8-3 TaxID=2589905 RepID=UPI0011292100|nr:hypothetical protein [Mesorhizobium sp. B2-8-3]TPJ36331.1 hypothetical protein FJ418_04375 [Mesorhizobium sp. B2-8-3]
MSQDAADLESTLPLWEYTFQTNDKQRKHAIRSFSVLRHGRLWRSTMIGVAWAILIIVLIVIIWLCAAAVAGLEYIAQDFISTEAVFVMAPMAVGALYLLVSRSITGYFKRKLKNKEIGESTASVKIFGGYLAQFSDNGSTETRNIERVFFSNDYLFFLIDQGTRFIYIPRDLVAADAFEKIKIWAAQSRI